MRCLHFEGEQGQEQSASLNDNQHPCPLGGSKGNRKTLCKREIAYTVTKVCLDWLVHLKRGLVRLGTLDSLWSAYTTVVPI